ncbi:MAG: MFS transporter [Pseudomonadota bacterium]
MSLAQAARVSRAQIAALAGVGVFWGSFAAMVPSFKDAIGASDSVMGLVLMMTPVGAIIAMLLAARAPAVVGRLLLPSAGVLLAVVAAFPALAATPAAFGAAMFALGFAVSFYDMAANMRIAVLETRHGVHLQNLCHAMFSFSFGGSAFVATIARTAGWSPVDILPWLVAALLALAFLSDEGPDWAPGPMRRDHPDARLPFGIVAIVTAILFAAFLSENANESWSALHIERTLGAPPGEGGFGPTMLGLTMGIGRLSGQVLTARLGLVRLIFWGGIVGTAGLVLLALAPVKEIAVLGVGVFGLGVAVMVPTANAVLARMVPPALQGPAIARAWIVGFAGFFVGPSLIGFVAEATDLRVAFLLVATIFASVVPLILMLRRRGA